MLIVDGPDYHRDECTSRIKPDLINICLIFVSGKFDSSGIATGVVDESIGKVKALRLNVHSESENWAILSEVS